MSADAFAGLDLVQLSGVRASGHHGVFPEERRDGQEFRVDVTLGLDVRPAAAGDDLARTADYGTLAQGVVDDIGADPVDLIETLAERLAVRCLLDDAVQVARVTVHKPQAPVPVPFSDVAVTVTRSRMPQPAVLALGANLGDRLAALQGGVAGLATLVGVTVVAVSPVYETDPVGGPEQGAYLNAVVLVETRRSAAALLAAAHLIEAEHGRTREIRWGARTLDIDLIAYTDQTSDRPGLLLPHPRAYQRGFVLAPWHAVDPGAVLPGRGPVAALLTGVDTSGVRVRPDLRLTGGQP